MVTLLLLLHLAPRAMALDVSGVISTNTLWGTNDSPYVVVAPLTVQANITLTLAPGVAVYFWTNTPLRVQGTLLAQGTADAPITFAKHPGATRRGGVRIEGAGFTNTATGHFSHCRFSDLQFSPGAVSSSYADIQVIDCTATNIGGKSIYVQDSRITVLRLNSHNTGEALNTVRCAGLIASNTVRNVDGNADAIDIDLAWQGPGDPSLVLEWNVVEGGSHSNADGVDFGTTANVVARYNHVRGFGDKGFSIGEGSKLFAHDNLIHDCAMGVAIKDSSTPVLANFTIVDCTVGIENYEKNAGQGGGLGTITNFVIWNCGTPILLDPLSRISVGYSVLETPWPGPGNRTGNPQFVNAAADDFRVLPGSSAIDGGITQGWMATATDIDGAPRVIGSAPDSGCFEFSPGALQVNLIASPLTGPAPLTTTLSAYATGTNLNGLTYAWDLDGDGLVDQTGTDLGSVTGTYSTIGYHSVGLTVANTAGETAGVFRVNYLRATGPANVYISPTGGHEFPYDSWTRAATNPADALAIAFAGTDVWVTNGIYAVPLELTLAHPVALRAVGAREATIFDGQQAGRVMRLTHAGASVQGITLTGGLADEGAGLYVAAGSVTDCLIIGNHATVRGGGVFLSGQAPLSACTISNNTAVTEGGGVYATAGAIISRSVVTGNRCTANDGGGLYLVGGSTVRSSLIADNEAFDRGGGIYLTDGGTADACTVVFNRASTTGGGVRMLGTSVLRNSIVWSNTCPVDANIQVAGTITYSCSTPAPAGTGNFASDPRFDNSGTFRLLPDSPCLETGQTQPWMATAQDLAGQPRVVGPTVDRGCYESGALHASFTVTPAAGPVPLSVVFSATASGANLTGISYHWDFTDDAVVDVAGGGRATVTNLYTEPGLFDVTLVVSNAIGETQTTRIAQAVNVTPTEMFVSLDGDHAYPYATWADAATNLHSAVAAASAGIRVWVADGVYPVTTPVVLNQALTVSSTGGAARAWLSATGDTRVVTMTAAGAVLEGFTITGGHATDGGGISLTGGGLVRDCVISNNTATTRGGGLYLINGGTVQRCVLANNRSTGTANADGGGMKIEQQGSVVDSVFIGNYAGDDGGGLHSQNGGIARRCRFEFNEAYDKGGGFFLAGTSLAESCLAHGNLAALGGGVSSQGATFDSCTVVSNRATASPGGGGLYAQTGGASFNTIYQGNQAPGNPNYHAFDGGHTYQHCLLNPYTAGVGNSTDAAVFVNAAAADYRLALGSAGIDGGTNRGVSVFALDGVPRPLDGDNNDMLTADIGAYETVHPDADSDGDGLPDHWELDEGFAPLLPADGAQDADDDQASNYEEYVAGTSPTNALDVLAIQVINSGAGHLSMTWPSALDRHYTVYVTTNLLLDHWTPGDSMDGNGGLLSVSNTLPADSLPRFHRLGVTW